jgi:hypothetical protein
VLVPGRAYAPSVRLAARVLLEAGLRADAVSRAYYAMLHAASIDVRQVPHDHQHIEIAIVSSFPRAREPNSVSCSSRRPSAARTRAAKSLKARIH